VGGGHQGDEVVEVGQVLVVEMDLDRPQGEPGAAGHAQAERAHDLHPLRERRQPVDVAGLARGVGVGERHHAGRGRGPAHRR
jgi:hypothetical protein